MIMKLIRIMLQEQNWGIWLYLIYILSAQFQLENWNAPARLDSARNLFSSSWLSSGNFSSNSSLLATYLLKFLIRLIITFFSVGYAILCSTSVFILWWSSNKQRFEHLSEFAFEMQDVSRFFFKALTHILLHYWR